MEIKKDSREINKNFFKIRNVSESDIDTLYDIEVRAFKAPFSINLLKQLARTKNVLYLVGEINQEIVGYSIVSLRSEEAHVISIVIDNNYRRKGYASALLRKNLQQLKKHNISNLILEVRVSNRPAREFYLKFNFKPIKTKVSYYSDGEDAIEMELNL